MSMDREHLLGERRDDEFFTIYVNNLPVELNEDGITQIFKSYGEICSLFTPPNAQWAYVSYKTYREAEHAIRALNERGPLYLNVAFRKKKIQPKSQSYSPDAVNEVPIDTRDYRSPQKATSHNGHCRKIVPGALAMNLVQMPNYNHDKDIPSVYPLDVDHDMYNPFENTGRYADTNSMWSRGCTNIDERGRKFVSMGRGYTQYHIPEPPYHQYEQHIGRVYEKRRAGFYQYGDDSLQHEIGKCLYCGHTAKLRCAKCNAFYCSRECQVGDWSRHKMECKIIPPLIGDFDAVAFSCSSTDDQCHVRKPRGIIELGHLNSLRRPKKVTNMVRTKNSVDAESPKDVIPNDQTSRPATRSPGREEQNEISVITQRLQSVQSPKRENDMSRVIKDVDDSYHENQRYDENANAKEISRQDSSISDNKNFRANFSLGRTTSNEAKPRSKASNSVGSVEATRADFIKMERELAFERDPRALMNIANQAPVICDSPVNISSPVQKETVGIVTPATSVPTIMKLETVPISKDSLTKVHVVVVMSDETFWINRNEDASKIESMMVELNEKASKFAKATDLIVGSIYAVTYENIWHRARILSTEPTKILYIDFGNDEPPQSNDFRLLTDFTNYPAYAIRVRLSSGSKAKKVLPDEQLTVRMIDVDENGIVEVIDHDPVAETTGNASSIKIAAETPQIMEIPASIEQSSSHNLSSIVDGLKIGDEGFIQIYLAIDNHSYAVCILSNDFAEQFSMIYETLIEVCNTMKEPSDFSPKIGDFVCGKRENAWLRGHVFSLGPPIRLALVDETNISSVERVIPMPAGYENICSFGAICTFDVGGMKFNVSDTARFQVTGIVDDAGKRIVKAAVLDDDNATSVGFTIKNWIPTPEQKGIRLAELKSNTEVCISAYSSERIMYVRSLDTESLERAQRIIQNVAKSAQTAPKLDGPPAIGQFVLAKFIDGNFYRAVVTKLQDNKIIVSYVDYGNTELTTIDQLRIMSDELKEQKSCATKVVLKNVKEDVPPTKEVHQYLDLLVGKEQPLICKFEGIPSKDGVILTTATGECINEKVNTFLTPQWQREDPSKNLKCFMLDDLETANLGEIGHVVQALPLHATDPPFKYVMAPFDREHLTHVGGILPELLRQYCESTKEHYIPRDNELCLAVYEGGWYRGTCLKRHETPNQALIHFVDWGNVEKVDYVNIRQMTKDFMSPPALGLCCIVKNLNIPFVNGKVPENIQRRLDELIPLNQLIDVKVIKKASSKDGIDGDYEVEFPSVREKLIAEGLVKP